MVQDYCYAIPRRPIAATVLSPTVPRGPIAAMFASPGPALYTLPTLVGRTEHDPRSAHVRYPAYSIASRVYMHKQDQSPGPKYLPPAKVLCEIVSTRVTYLGYISKTYRRLCRAECIHAFMDEKDNDGSLQF